MEFEANFVGIAEHNFLTPNKQQKGTEQMAQLPNGVFDATKHDPTQSVGNLPIGRHKVIIETSEVKANSAGDGGYLQLNLRVIEGPSMGAEGAYRLNLYHAKQQTVEIAQRQLSAICHVIGVFQVQDSSQLHNIPFYVEVAPQKNDPQYTEVKKVFDLAGNEPGKQGQRAAAAPQPGDETMRQVREFEAKAAAEAAARNAANAGNAGWGQPPAGATPTPPKWGQPANNPTPPPPANNGNNGWQNQGNQTPTTPPWAK